LFKAAGCQPGDLLLVLAGTEAHTRRAISDRRLEMGQRLGLRDANQFARGWAIDFPLFEWADKAQSVTALDRSFTAPKPDQVALLDDPNSWSTLLANAYDLVMNGTEIGGGSLRIYRRDIQEKMFSALGMSSKEAASEFGFLMDAFEFGAPPHGGIALG